MMIEFFALKKIRNHKIRKSPILANGVETRKSKICPNQTLLKHFQTKQGNVYYSIYQINIINSSFKPCLKTQSISSIKIFKIKFYLSLSRTEFARTIQHKKIVVFFSKRFLNSYTNYWDAQRRLVNDILIIKR